MNKENVEDATRLTKSGNDALLKTGWLEMVMAIRSLGW